MFNEGYNDAHKGIDKSKGLSEAEAKEYLEGQDIYYDNYYLRIVNEN
jgi:hypothetical protein